jgi:GTPase involved in cell partitioning and DNA repair
MPRFAEIPGAGLTLADIGCISKAASVRKAAGAAFLKYLEAAAVLVFVIPLKAGRAVGHIAQCAAQYEHLLSVCRERPGFADKGRVIALNLFTPRTAERMRYGGIWWNIAPR